VRLWASVCINDIESPGLDEVVDGAPRDACAFARADAERRQLASLDPSADATLTDLQCSSGLFHGEGEVGVHFA
jgi:hypothetical protein